MSGPIDLQQLKRAHEHFLKQQDGWLNEALAIAAKQADEHVKKRSKFHRRSPSSSLKDSTKSRVIKTSGGKRLRLSWSKRVGNWDLAEIIEYGSRPHLIRPRRRRALAFTVRGRSVVTSSVMHPGTRPYKFGWNATNAAFRVVTKRLDERVRNARFRW